MHDSSTNKLPTDERINEYKQVLVCEPYVHYMYVCICVITGKYRSNNIPGTFALLGFLSCAIWLLLIFLLLLPLDMEEDESNEINVIKQLNDIIPFIINH